MAERSHLYSAECYTTALRPQAAEVTLPGIHHELQSRAMASSAEWRFPIYKEWWNSQDIFERPTDKPHGLWSRVGRWFLSPFRALARTSYIEWRYYSILSREFHGIIGAALFNPEGRLNAVAESGLLIIVAGVAATASAGSGELCWMKLFPTSSLGFSGTDTGVLRAEHDGISLTIEQHDPGAATILLSGVGAPQIQFEMASVPGTSVRPAWGEDLKRVPGAHWVIHNAAPMASVTGNLLFRADCWPRGGSPSRDFPSVVSPEVACAMKAGGGQLALDFSGNGYYEHSFGMNPMPLHGWDFFFAPDVVGRRAVVLQTYPRSEDLRYLEVFWEEGGLSRYLRFPSSSLNISWERAENHTEIRQRVPLLRRIHASWGGYHIEIENQIQRRIPFLRPEKLFVRHFYISEEMGRTSWTLRDSTGAVVSSAQNVMSGGETASVRWRV